MSETRKLISQKTLGLALGGGGARGLAHIGVLKGFTAQQITVSCISGCSMGGLVGSLYALGFTISELEQIALKHTGLREMINLVDRTPSRRGLIVGQRLRSLLEKIIGKETKFSDTTIPVSLNATDLISSKEITLSDGNLVDAIMATIAIPGFFAPVPMNGQLLVDGGTLNNLPVQNLIEFKPDVSIAVDVHPDVKNEIPWQISGQKPRILFPMPDYFFDYYRAQLIMISQLTENKLEKYKPSMLIRPVLPSEITMFSGYQQASLIIEAGMASVTKNMDQIKALLH